ncbi:MAG: prolipoprotein diacylglyceryl transferase, partial [Proteobacteria bacterium]|nr:prolipoprotein diacylglyceryl transferase [Pseudomonadota bacterium]
MDSYFVWDVSRIIFSIPLGPLEFPIRWYSLMFICAFIAGIVIVGSMFARENKSSRAFEMLPTYVIIATILGARLGHIFFYNPTIYLTDPIKIFKVWEGGLASHGGYLFVIIALILFAKRYSKEIS